MKANLQDAERNIVSEQAAKWLSELPGSSARERAEFVTWLKQSPGHVEEFLFAAAALKTLSQSRPTGDANAQIEAIVAEALAAKAGNVVPFEQTSRGVPQDASSPPRALTSAARRTRIALAFAALLGSVAVGLFWSPSLMSFLGRDAIATSVGEQRTIRLADGSVVYLNARSRIHVSYSDAARDVELLEGEAVFKVEQDASRPFRVHSGDAVVQAVGTQFNVYRRAAGTVVSVIEGKVEVRSGDTVTSMQAPDTHQSSPPVQGQPVRTLLVAAGEQASIASGGELLKYDEPHVAAAVAWRERRLVFDADRLEDIAAEFARYSPRLIRLEDRAAREKRITGTFEADDPGSLVLFLERLDELTVERDGEHFVVRGR